MFKIIKPSTYKELQNKALLLHLAKIVIDGQNTEIAKLETQLHHLTANKLPIKKSKNK